MGGYRGAPVELVKCETNDLLVPAGAEIVIEGSISPDPATYELEGPFGDATGHVSDIPTRKPVIAVSCVTHRRDPIFRGTLEGTLPGSMSDGYMGSIQRAASAWTILENASIPGIRDVVCTAGDGGRERRCPDPQDVPGAAQADRRRAVGQQRVRSTSTSTCGLSRKRSTRPTTSSSTGRSHSASTPQDAGRHHRLPRHLRLRARPELVAVRARCRAAGHGDVEPRADRRDAQLGVRAARGMGRRAFPSDRQAGARGRGARARAVEGFQGSTDRGAAGMGGAARAARAGSAPSAGLAAPAGTLTEAVRVVGEHRLVEPSAYQPAERSAAASRASGGGRRRREGKASSA